MDEISINRLSTMCRLCLASDVTMSDIFAFSTQMRNQLIANVIMKCAPVQITRRDGMSNFICQLCYIKLEKSHQFKIQVVQSDKTLRRYQQQLPASDKQIKTECSTFIQDPLIYDSNPNITVKCESLELYNVFDTNVNLKEKTSANVYSKNKTDGNTHFKYEIKNKPMNDKSLFSIKCTDHSSFKSDGSVNSCEDTKIGISSVVMKEDINIVNWKEKEPENFSSVNNINDAGFLKSEHQGDDASIRPGNIEDKQIKTECSIQGHSEDPLICKTNTDITVKYESLNLDNKLDVKVNSKKISANVYYSKNKINENTPFKPEINDEPIDDNFIFLPEYAEDTVDFTENVDESQKRKHISSLNHEKHKKANITNDHKRRHTSEKPYQCDICIKCFTTSYNLKCHKRIHTGEKPYQCDVCSKCFTSKNINSHKRTHTGEKPYQCDLCNKFFRQSNNLNRHKRTHTGDKPYHCDVCNKCFTTSSNLNEHKRTHTGEKPYKCNVCKMCFTHSNSLTRHKASHS